MTISPRIVCGSSLVGLLLLLAGGTVWGAEALQTYPASGTLPFLGLDDTSAPTEVQDGRASDLQNVKLSLSKDLRQRDGISLIGTTLDLGADDTTGVDSAACVVTGLYYTKFSSGTERIVSTCGSRFAYLSGASWETVSGAEVVQTSGQNNQFVWATALDEIIGTNDVDAPIRYNGTTLDVVNFTDSDLATTSRVSAAKTVAFFKNFLIFANTVEGGTDYPTRFRWAEVGTTTNWALSGDSDGNYVDIGALGGQEINCLAELYDNLYVGLTDSLYRISFVAGADTFNVSKVTDDIGCIAKNSVQSITLTNAQNGLVFLDKDKKVYFFDGVTVRDISPLIITTMNALNGARLQYAVSTDTNTDYYLCLTNGSAGVNNLCLDFQYQIGEWTKHVNLPANAMAHVLNSNGQDENYFGSYESFVYQLEDDDLVDDVGSASDTVSSVSAEDTTTASGLQVLYQTGHVYTAGALAGAPILLTGGTGSGLTSTVANNTTSGIIVTDAFSTTPTSTTTFTVGAIDSYYTTKWYDVGDPARLKHFWKLDFWAQEGEVSGIDVSYATDFNTDVSTQTISLDAATDDAIWGSAIWGTSLWGSNADVFREVKLDRQGRYLRVKWDEDDAGETFHLYNWTPLFRWGNVN